MSHYNAKNFKIILLIVCLVFTLFFSFVNFFHKNNYSSPSKYNETTKLLENISQEDQQWLKLFFKEVFLKSELGYTLFGDKPLSFHFLDIETYNTHSQNILFDIDNFFDRTQKPYGKGFEIWRKYESLFETKNYFLFFPNNDPSTVFLINKKSFIKVCQQNIELVRQVYGKDLDCENFLKKILVGEIDLLDIKSHKLLGILLGFGKQNSELFEKMMQNENSNLHYFYNLAYMSKFVNPLHFEYRFDVDVDLYLLLPRVIFGADPNNAETNMLRRSYRNTTKKIKSVVQNPDWFNLVLIQLTS